MSETDAPPRVPSPAPARAGRRLLRIALVLLTLGLAGVTALRWLPVSDQVLVALVAARWLVGLAAAGLFVVTLLARDRIAIAVAGALLVVHAAIAAPFFIGSSTAATDDSVTVLAANLEYGEADLDALARSAAEIDADVLVLTEAAYLGDRIEVSGLAESFPHRLGQESQDARGTMVLSRWPATLLDPGRATTFDQPLVQVETPAGPVQVKGIHSAPPGDLHPWRGELEQLAATPAGDVPLVLAGDFNASSDHDVFRRLTARFPDAHEQVGAGWVRTWNAAGRPFVQIDHVLVYGLRTQDAGVIELPGTDHKAVWARVAPLDG